MAYAYKKYTPGQTVTDAQTALDQQQQMKPAEYQSQWQDKISQKTDEILSRKPFEYDVNADQMYQQLVDNYVRNGKMAMMDTMGQASAMTGGYGNSYANMAGQQVYQQYLSGLTDRIPEFQKAALDRYNAEGDRMLQEYSLLGDREQQDYSRYQDQYNQWANWLDYLTGRLDTERNMDYSMFDNERNQEYAMYQQDQALAQKQVDYLLSIGAEVPDDLAAMSGYNGAFLKSAAQPASQEPTAAQKATQATWNLFNNMKESLQMIAGADYKSEADRKAAYSEAIQAIKQVESARTFDSTNIDKLYNILK